MTLQELMAAFRVDAQDQLEPFLVPDDQLKAWLNEAVAEAAVRARLLHDSSTAAVCQIPVTAGQAVYPLHPALYEIDHIAIRATGEQRRHALTLTSREDMDGRDPDWRDRTDRLTTFAIQSDTGLRLVYTPRVDGMVLLEGYRLPLVALVNNTDTPEIHQAHHRHLVYWVLYRTYSVPDSELLDAGRAAEAEAKFTAHFGPAPDADLRRRTREDVPHRVMADWP